MSAIKQTPEQAASCVGELSKDFREGVAEIRAVWSKKQAAEVGQSEAHKKAPKGIYAKVIATGEAVVKMTDNPLLRVIPVSYAFKTVSALLNTFKGVEKEKLAKIRNSDLKTGQKIRHTLNHIIKKSSCDGLVAGAVFLGKAAVIGSGLGVTLIAMHVLSTSVGHGAEHTASRFMKSTNTLLLRGDGQGLRNEIQKIKVDVKASVKKGIEFLQSIGKAKEKTVQPEANHGHGHDDHGHGKKSSFLKDYQSIGKALFHGVKQGVEAVQKAAQSPSQNKKPQQPKLG